MVQICVCSRLPPPAEACSNYFYGPHTRTTCSTDSLFAPCSRLKSSLALGRVVAILIFSVTVARHSLQKPVESSDAHSLDRQRHTIVFTYIHVHASACVCVCMNTHTMHTYHTSMLLCFIVDSYMPYLLMIQSSESLVPSTPPITNRKIGEKLCGKDKAVEVAKARGLLHRGLGIFGNASYICCKGL